MAERSIDDCKKQTAQRKTLQWDITIDAADFIRLRKGLLDRQMEE